MNGTLVYHSLNPFISYNIIYSTCASPGITREAYSIELFLKKENVPFKNESGFVSHFFILLIAELLIFSTLKYELTSAVTRCKALRTTSCALATPLNFSNITSNTFKRTFWKSGKNFSEKTDHSYPVYVHVWRYIIS